MIVHKSTFLSLRNISVYKIETYTRLYLKQAALRDIAVTEGGSLIARNDEAYEPAS